MVAITTHTEPSLRTPANTPAGFIMRFTNETLAGKLLSMGVLPGSRFELVRRAPFGGGWYVKVDNLLLALRREEVESIVLRT